MQVLFAIFSRKRHTITELTVDSAYHLVWFLTGHEGSHYKKSPGCSQVWALGYRHAGIGVPCENAGTLTGKQTAISGFPAGMDGGKMHLLGYLKSLISIQRICNWGTVRISLKALCAAFFITVCVSVSTAESNVVTKARYHSLTNHTTRFPWPTLFMELWPPTSVSLVS